MLVCVYVNHAFKHYSRIILKFKLIDDNHYYIMDLCMYNGHAITLCLPSHALCLDVVAHQPCE